MDDRETRIRMNARRMVESQFPSDDGPDGMFEEYSEAARMRATAGARINSGDLPEQPEGLPSDPLAGAPPPWSNLTSGR